MPPHRWGVLIVGVFWRCGAGHKSEGQGNKCAAKNSGVLETLQNRYTGEINDDSLSFHDLSTKRSSEKRPI